MPDDQGEWWTRIPLPDGVQSEVYHAAGRDHVCLFGPSRKAIEDMLRDWSGHPFFEFDPPEMP